MTENQTTNTHDAHIPTVAKGTTWSDAYNLLERNFELVIEVKKSAEAAEKDREAVERLGSGRNLVGEDAEGVDVELRRLGKPNNVVSYDLYEIWEANDFFTQEGEFDKSVFETALAEFIRTVASS